MLANSSSRTPDSQNSFARQFAVHRLNQAAAAGLIRASDLGGMKDPTAAWRAVSASIASDPMQMQRFLAVASPTQLVSEHGQGMGGAMPAGPHIAPAPQLVSEHGQGMGAMPAPPTPQFLPAVDHIGGFIPPVHLPGGVMPPHLPPNLPSWPAPNLPSGSPPPFMPRYGPTPPNFPNPNLIATQLPFYPHRPMAPPPNGYFYE
jgi:hypothetical protein